MTTFRWIYLLLLTGLLSGCLSLPDHKLIDTAMQSETLPRLPQSSSSIWISEQGLPLRVKWLKEGSTPLPDGEMFILPYTLTTLPYKNSEENSAWVNNVNLNYSPSEKWTHDPERRMGHYKCMSISSSTIVDWHNLRRGRQLKGYRSWLSGMNEHGMDHRKLDAWYYHLAEEQDTADDYPLLTLHMDPVERTPISYDMEAFTRIIEMGGSINNPLTIPDQVLQDVTHRIKPGEMPPVTIRKLFGYKNSLSVSRNPSAHNKLIIDALKNSGPVFAGIRVRFATSGGVVTNDSAARISLPKMSGHGVVILGYIRQGKQYYFVYRETFGNFDNTSQKGGPAYRAYPVHAFNEAYAFLPK